MCRIAQRRHGRTRARAGLSNHGGAIDGGPAGAVGTGIAQPSAMGTILLVILILMLLGAVPAWPHSRSWGYGPSGGLGLVVIILLVLILTGRL